MFFNLNDLYILISLISISILCATIAPVVYVKKDITGISVISHGSILSLILSYVLKNYFYNVNIALLMYPSVVISSLVFLSIYKFFATYLRIKSSDAGMLTMSILLSFGIFLASWLYPFSHIGESMIFGNVSYVTKESTLIISSTAITSLLLFLILRKFYYITALDESFAKSIGINTKFINVIIIIHSSIAISISCYIFGVIIATSFFVGSTFASYNKSISMNDFVTKTFFVSFLISSYSLLYSFFAESFLNFEISLAGLISIFTWVASFLAKEN